MVVLRMPDPVATTLLKVVIKHFYFKGENVIQNDKTGSITLENLNPKVPVLDL